MTLIKAFKSVNLALFDEKIRTIEMTLEKEISTIIAYFFEQKNKIDALKEDALLANETPHNEVDGLCPDVPRTWRDYQMLELTMQATLIEKAQCIKDEHRQLLAKITTDCEAKIVDIEKHYLKKLYRLNSQRQEFSEAFHKAKETYLHTLNHSNDDYHKQIANRLYQEQCLAIDLDICASLYYMLPVSMSTGNFTRFFNSADCSQVYDYELNFSAKAPDSPNNSL